MKNIHVLPTDKPSKFFKDNVRHAYYFYYDDVKFKSNLAYTAQNIYITSDEEIKQKELCYCISNNCIVRFSNFGDNQKNYKKIILTTDQDLIKDGVQAIDGKSLEWLVENKRCEYVNIESTLISMEFHKPAVIFHKIILPKEELKQDCCTPIGQIKRYKDCIGCDRKPRQETLGLKVSEETVYYQVLIVNNKGEKLAFKQNDKWTINASTEEILDKIFKTI